IPHHALPPHRTRTVYELANEPAVQIVDPGNRALSARQLEGEAGRRPEWIRMIRLEEEGVSGGNRDGAGGRNGLELPHHFIVLMLEDVAVVRVKAGIVFKPADHTQRLVRINDRGVLPP